MDDVRASFDEATFRRGMNYARIGRVLRIARREEGEIEAHVVGSAATPYHVTIEVVPERRGFRLATYCSCPVEYRCKHAAAAAVAALPYMRNSVSGAPTRAHDPTDSAASAWMRQLEAYREPSAEAGRGEHIRYVLDLAEGDPHVTLVPRVVSMLKSGEWSMGRAVELQNLNYAAGNYVAPIDRTIGRLATASGLTGDYRLAARGANVSPRLLALLLAETIKTERLHWRSTRTPHLVRCDLADQRFAWGLDAQARQLPSVAGRQSLRLIAANPIWYVDSDRSLGGTIDFGVAPEAAALVVIAPPLTPQNARRVQGQWRRVFGPSGVAAPESSVVTTLIERDPVPVLRLRGCSRAELPASILDSLPAVAELAFAYGAQRVHPRDELRELQEVDGGRVSRWPRRYDFEATARASLHHYGFEPVSWPEMQYLERFSTMRFPGAGEGRWAEFLDTGVPDLRVRGWTVEVDASFPYELVEAEEWDAHVASGDNDWFEFDLGIKVGADRVSLLPIVLDALRELGIRSQEDLARFGERALYGRLRPGAFVALPLERITPVLATLIELFDASLTAQGRLALTPAHLASLAQLEQTTTLRWSAGESLRDVARTLSDEASLEAVALPSQFAGTLRQYQSRGVAWLQLLARSGFGGVLADDMGLGKTVQFLAHVAVEKAAGRLKHPVLIVSPTSVSPNWRAEIARFVPHLKALALTGADRFAHFAQIDRSDLVLTTYALLQRDIEELSAQQWQIAVLDEAQAVKNPRSKGAQAAARLRARQRLALTGTPMENHLEELWSVFSFAVPGLLGDRVAFGRVFRTPIEKRGDAHRRRVLASRLRPFLLRRTKESVALDLPLKSEIVTRIELNGGQRDLYETIRVAMHERIRSELRRRGLARSQIVVLDALLKLRQICCDPRLLKLSAARSVSGSAKLEALLEMLPELIDEGRRILLFSQFTSMLDLIKPELHDRRIAFAELRGDTKDRVTPVRRFQNGEVPLFLISLKAGGTGLNLTAADTVIHYDPWWNPAVQRQATDRAHRIGQHRPVFVYKLITAGTVEERILDLQRRKGELAAGLFEESASIVLDAAEVDRLFAPI
jgi:superfamily II DNA or RNA helicase